jgi:hypothetical protein
MYQNMKEHKIPKNTFILGRYIPEKICDNIVNIFKKNKKYARPGSVGLKEIKTDYKISLDIGLHSTDSGLVDYNVYLNEMIKEYDKIYHFNMLGVGSFNNLQENTNIQYYKPNEGFFKYHTERAGIHSTKRCLVFMTYLNDVPDGGTEFLFQKLKIPAKKGLTLIWPSDFTHAHRGIISKTKEKYIITGWFNFV